MKNLIASSTHDVSALTRLFGQQLPPCRDVVNQHLEVSIFDSGLTETLSASFLKPVCCCSLETDQGGSLRIDQG